jgi:multidrug efflux pump subunit AcrB
VTSLEVEERWRRLVGEIPHAVEPVELRFAGETLLGEPALSLQLSGPDRGELRSVSDELKALLRAIPGTRDIYDSFSTGKRELQLSIRPEAEAFGLTLAELMRQVRQGFHGQEVQRLQRGRDDVAVVVRYPLGERRSLADLENVWIRTPQGGEVPFSTVGRIERGRSYSTIRREDRRNVVEVFADADTNVITATQLLEELERHELPALLGRHPEVRVSLAGAKREEAELLSVLFRRWLLAMLAAYAVMAIPFRSYLQPLLVFAVIPFGFVGAVAGHALIGMDFSVFSLVGLVALTGVVVNDALVLIDAVNRQRAAGLPLVEALHEACARRFRAILLTSLTTSFGLLPLLSERSAQAAWLKPMGVTLAVGVLFATVVTLLLLPACYLLLDDLQQRLRPRVPL